MAGQGAGIEELDIHGMNTYGARVCLDSKLKKTKAYRLRVIHGHHGGQVLQQLVRTAYKNHPKVLRVEVGLNQGETDLVLKEF